MTSPTLIHLWVGEDDRWLPLSQAVGLLRVSNASIRVVGDARDEKDDKARSLNEEERRALGLRRQTPRSM